MFWDFYTDTTKIEFVALLAFLVFTYWQLRPTSSCRRNTCHLPVWYHAVGWDVGAETCGVKVEYFAPVPPGWFFGAVWTVLYALITASAFLYWRDNNSSTVTYYGWSLFLYFFNIILNKLWTPLFFGISDKKENRGYIVPGLFVATVVAFLIFASALSFSVLVGLDGVWTSFGLWMPYTVWSAYAFIINIYYLAYGRRLSSVIKTGKYEKLNQL